MLRRALQISLGKRMPTVDGHLEVPGIKGRVLIRRDAFGIPHIDARNEADAWYAWGFCQGQDRAFQIETRVRVVRGRLAELIGPEGLPVDRLSRRMGLARHAQAQFEVLNDHGRSTIQAFCRGVIEGSRIGATRRAHEFRLLNVRPTPLEPSDVLGSLALVSFLLASNWDSEISRLKILEADGPDALAALDPTYPEWLSVISPPGQSAGPHVSALIDELEGFLKFTGIGSGSNNWAVDGSRTASGLPIVANDPHLSSALPAHWYLGHITTPDFEVAGASMAGTPGIAVGHNESVAWGITAGQVDNTDLFLEMFNETGDRVKGPDGWEPFESWTETIRVKGADDVQIDIIETDRGPLIGDVLEPDCGALSIKATWLAPRDAQGILVTHQAQSTNDLFDRMGWWPGLSMNVVAGDVDGIIGWKLVGDTPQRTDGFGIMPTPAWNPQAGWTDTPIDPSDMPSIIAPEAGFVATANNRSVPNDYPTFITHDWQDAYRATRATELLAARSDWDISSTQQMQLDRVSLVWRDVREAIESVDATNPQVRDALLILKGWDGDLGTDSVAATVFQAFLWRLIRRVCQEKAPNSYEWAMGKSMFSLLPAATVGSRRMQHIVQVVAAQPADWFADSTWQDELAQALEGAMAECTERLGSDTDDWRWGHVRPLTLTHPVSAASPVMAKVFDIGPMPYGGDAHSLNNGAVIPGDIWGNPYGIASMRMVSEVGSWNSTRFVLAGGQSGNPCSPHYDDLIPLWLSGDGVVIAWGEDAVRRSTESALQLTPETR